MTKPALQEQERLAALRRLQILDTMTEKDYDDITFLASRICQTPISLISFVDEDRQWFKSHLGVDLRESAREFSICDRAIATVTATGERKPFIIPDLRRDERFSSNPFVVSEPRIVFYAGVPLVSSDGFGLGTVCVIDTRERELTGEQIEALGRLADQVMNLLEMRMQNHELQDLRLRLEARNTDLEQFAMVVAHDIKSPLASVLLANEMLRADFNEALGPEGAKFTRVIQNAADRIGNLVDGILEYYKQGSDHLEEQSHSLQEILDSITSTQISTKPYKVNLPQVNSRICMNRTQLEQVFLNLISNSIRYNDSAVAEIDISFREDAFNYYFTLRDNGIGIAAENHNRIFNLFQTISKNDRFGVKSNGIGLPTVKKIIESHGGAIRVDSEPGKGSVFTFSILKAQAIPGLSPQTAISTQEAPRETV